MESPGFRSHKPEKEGSRWLNEEPQMPNSGANPKMWFVVGIAGIILTYMLSNKGDPIVDTNCGEIHGVRHNSAEDTFKYYSFMVSNVKEIIKKIVSYQYEVNT